MYLSLPQGVVLEVRSSRMQNILKKKTICLYVMKWFDKECEYNEDKKNETKKRLREQFNDCSFDMTTAKNAKHQIARCTNKMVLNTLEDLESFIVEMYLDAYNKLDEIKQ